MNTNNNENSAILTNILFITTEMNPMQIISAKDTNMLIAVHLT